VSKQVAIMGAGGHAHVIASILRTTHASIYGYFDDSCDYTSEIIKNAPLLGRFNDIVNYKKSIQSVYLALGDNQIRKKFFDFLIHHGFLLPSLLHPTATVESDTVINDATVICLGTLIGTEVTIGKGSIINTGCSVDHESLIGDFVHLAPKVAVAGRTTIDDFTFVGINTTIADKLTIGRNVVIGAGSVILRDVPDGAKIVGVHR
jgi:sugar O-acyltransferase (sialic acid O-acetyltransferase NeuD family)